MTELVQSFMPALSLEQAIERRNILVKFTQQVMVKGVDYGEIPGTQKPTLLKPGAEKLSSLFGLCPTFEVVEKLEDWDKGFFYYWYRCRVYNGERVIAEGDGSCNTKEKKYRYRRGERLCPVCGKAAIIKGKAEFGGGYVCFDKKGGCKAKFKDGDPAIEGQPLGDVENTEPFDLVNTVQKMAQKRALVAATLIAVNASEFFTQDIEDLDMIEAEFRPAAAQSESTKPTPTAREAGPQAQQEAARKAPVNLEEEARRLELYDAICDKEGKTNGTRKAYIEGYLSKRDLNALEMML